MARDPISDLFGGPPVEGGPSSEPSGMDDINSLMEITLPSLLRERKVTLGTSVPTSIAMMIDELSIKLHKSNSSVIRAAVIAYLSHYGFDVSKYVGE